MPPANQTPNSATATVVIPAFNAGAYISDAIISAIAQKPYVAEIIVVDDGSTDGTAEIVAQTKDPEICLLTQTQSGPSAARNRGWRAARSAWIQFLDADDMLEPGSIQQLLQAAELEPGKIPFGLQTVYGSTFQGQPVLQGSLAPGSGMIIEKVSLVYGASIFSALIPKAALDSVGGFSEDIWHGEDYDLALKLAKRFEFARLNAPTYRARMHPGNRHRSYDQSSLNDFVTIVQRELGTLPGIRNQLLFRRSLANWYFYFGMLAKQSHLPNAAQLFRQAWQIQPWKIRAWKHWLESFLRRQIR